MHPDYSHALEKKREWLAYANERANFPGGLADSAKVYRHNLLHSDTFVMNRKFCELVDYARRTVPDDLVFEDTWTPTPAGWMWLVQPFEVPELAESELKRALYGEEKTGVSAVGWYRLTGDQIEEWNKGPGRTGTRHLNPGATQFSVFLDHAPYGKGQGFAMWSYFALNPGDTVGSRISLFEKASLGVFGSGHYIGSEMSMLHEVRWVYTALHLMSQRLTTTVKKEATRGTRKRFQRDRTPIAPEYRVVTLRRMEEDRAKSASEHQTVDWQWSWQVTGHWRSQWYPVEQEHKRIWIESYVKGDLEKPLKPTKTLYRVAK